MSIQAAASFVSQLHAFIYDPSTIWLTLIMGLPVLALYSTQPSQVTQPAQDTDATDEATDDAAELALLAESEPTQDKPLKTSELTWLKKVHVQAIAQHLNLDVDGLHRMTAIKRLVEAGLTQSVLDTIVA